MFGLARVFNRRNISHKFPRVSRGCFVYLLGLLLGAGDAGIRSGGGNFRLIY